jgi:methylmalonyl-CoA mutase N-terminal domain/subunit
VVDPLGGSYFVECLTQEMEDGARNYFDRIDALGGMVPAIEAGFPQREVSESAYRLHQAADAGEKTVVGVNRYTDELKTSIPTLSIDEDVGARQVKRLKRLRDTRDNEAVSTALKRLRYGAGVNENLLPILVDAVRAYATIGEMCDTLRNIWGEYEETPTL